MKLTVLLVLLMAPAVWAEEDTWVKYSESKDGCAYYVDTASIKPLASGWAQVNDGCLCEDGRVLLALKRVDMVNHRFMLDGALDVVNKVEYGPSSVTYDIVPGTVIDVLHQLLREFIDKNWPRV